jgi:L-aminopeptidase/D-esterase-like protein
MRHRHRTLALRPLVRGLTAAIAVGCGALALVVAQGRSSAPRDDSPAANPLPTTGKATGITAVPGIKVGHHVMAGRPTGCTVVLVDGAGAVGGVSQRGGAPGTVETDLLDPLNMVERVNAITLAGGSAFGLDVRQGVVRYLDERGIGFNVGAAGVVPIVPGAILIDLGFGGDPKIRPNADCGYRAASTAASGAVTEGNVGAGAGATVGKLGGNAQRAMKGGLGTASISLPNGLVVGALAVVNAVGDVVDPLSGQVVAGLRTEDGKSLANIQALIRSGALGSSTAPRPGANTTIAVVATNARLTKAEVARMALMADDGLARAIRPSHTTGDGDTVFALATGQWGPASPTIVGALAAEALAEAIVRAVVQAQALGGLPAARDLGTVPARFR